MTGYYERGDEGMHVIEASQDVEKKNDTPMGV